MEDPVHAVFVVSRSEDLRYQEFAAAGDDDGVVTEVCVFEEDACIFLVNADGIFDGRAGAGAVDEVGVHVVNCAFAVAT